MTTLDKINEELSFLEKELSQLHHYTNEIGNAKDAANKVIEMSDNFLTISKEKIASINQAMDNAGKIFKKNVNDTSGILETASTNFQQGIREASTVFASIGSKLDATARTVSNVAAKIEDVDINGNFTKLNSTIESMDLKIYELQLHIEKRIETLEKLQLKLYNNSKKNDIVSTALLVLLIFGLYLIRVLVV